MRRQETGSASWPHGPRTAAQRRGGAALLAPLLAALLAGAGLAAGCAHPARAATGADANASLPRAHWGVITHRVRATGLIVPARAVTLQVPQLQQQFAQLTLAFIAPSGIQVRQGQRVAAFDRTRLADAAADAEAQYRALGAQVREMEAKNAAEAAQRAVTLRKALADEGHARLELEKRPVLTGLEIAKDQVQLADARAHVRSLRQAGQWLTREAAAKLHALRLQRDEQKALWQRAGRDSRRMVLRAPMSGMLALALPPFMGQAVPGAKLYSGMPLLRIFDPSQMQVRAQISELDLTWMSPGAPAQVRIDAYPGLLLPAHLLRLNPIAVSSLGTPIHNFTATFSLDRGDPRALPDLNASVEITSAPRAGWLVPRSAVHYQHGQAFVWGRDARARRRRPVQVLAFGRRWIEIRAPWLGPGPNKRARGPARLLPQRAPLRAGDPGSRRASRLRGGRTGGPVRPSPAGASLPPRSRRRLRGPRLLGSLRLHVGQALACRAAGRNSAAFRADFAPGEIGATPASAPPSRGQS